MLVSSKVVKIAGLLMLSSVLMACSYEHHHYHASKRGHHEHHGPGRIAFMIQSLDADKNGSVSIEEFLANKENIFVEADTDADNFIHLAELLSYIRTRKMADDDEHDMGDGHYGKPHPGFVGKRMKRMDMDGDEKVSRDEFMNHARHLFGRLDKNGDAELTIEDHPPYGKQR